MDNELLEMIELLAAQLQLAWHSRSDTSTAQVNKAVKDAGALLKRRGFSSDMAAE